MGKNLLYLYRSRRAVLAALFVLCLTGLSEAATITYTSQPRTFQFFARDSQDSALITYSGTVLTAGYDSVFIEVYRNNLLWSRKNSKLNYVSGSAAFNIGKKIKSELADYRFKFYVKAGSTATLKHTADSLVCGDVYLVFGQSNAHPTSTSATFKDKYCRSFGVMTANYNAANYNPADTNWGMARADGAVYDFSGPYNVGIWALKLQEQIKNTYGIPTCVINGARASTPITYHMRNDANPTDLTTVYGKALYRVKKSYLQNSIKAIFWFQGESDGTTQWVNYNSNFKKLYNSWKQDYPGFSRLYLFQTRPCCSEPYASQLREVQRKLPEEITGIELMSTAWIPYYGGCHYSLYGYYAVADMVFRPLSNHYYGGTDTVRMRPPNVRSAFFTNSQKNEIAVLFNNSSIASWPADTLNQRMRDYFYLDGQTGKVQQGVISGDTLKLRLYTASNATKLTYLPTVWNHDDSLVYNGPFVKNSRGVGALSFHDFPIGTYNTAFLSMTAIVEGYYSSVNNRLTARDTLTVYLHRNYYPYQKCDSAKAIIDSLSFTGQFRFLNTPTGTYYLSVKSNNTLETWSKAPGLQIISGSSVSYNFTTSASQAYGNNLKLKSGKYCIYSSEVTGDGIIDVVDIGRVSNDVESQIYGTPSTDLNGDRLVDLEDLLIADNQVGYFIIAVRP